MRLLFLILMLGSPFYISGCGGGGGSASNGNNGSTGGARSTSSQSKSKESADLKVFGTVAIGAQNFHDAANEFPFRSSKLERHETLSWRAGIVPYLDIMANPADGPAFELKEPADSKKNLAVAKKLANKFQLSTGNLVCAIASETTPKKISDIKDGTSGTIMLLENPELSGKDWAKPGDLTPDEATQLVMNLKKGEYLLAAMYDASVVRVHSPEEKGISKEDVAALFTHADGRQTNTELLSY